MRFSFPAVLLTLVATMLFSSTGRADIAVDSTQHFQSITGFGTSIIGWNPDFAKLALTPNFQDIYVNQVGLNILRVQLVPQVSPKPIDDPKEIHFEDFAQEGETSETQAYWEFAQAITKLNPNEIVIGSVWSPPAWMKENNNIVDPQRDTRKKGEKVNNRLLPDHYQYFANWLVEYVKFYKSKGVTLYAISPQNEPYFTQTFGSCVYTPEEYAAMYKVVAAAFKDAGLDTKLFGPEHMTFDAWGNGQMLGALAKNGSIDSLDIFASHGYVDGFKQDVSKNSAIQMGKLAEKYKKPYWVTEGGTGDHSWPKPLGALGAMLHNSLVHGNAQAIVTWQITDSNPTEHDLMVMDQIDRKTNVAQQYYRFIHPGSVRVAATPSDGATPASAFLNEKEHTLTLILTNPTDKEQSVTVGLTIDPAITGITSFDTYRTSKDEGFKKLDATPLIDGKLNLTLPPQSIQTYYGKGTGN